MKSGQALGLLGGGQLGRLFIQAAHKAGFTVTVLDPDVACPAAIDADTHIALPYNDPDGIAQLCSQSTAVTVEFENIPSATLQQIAQQSTLRPSPRAIGIAADRRLEKEFLARIGMRVAPFEVIESLEDVRLIAASKTLSDQIFGPAIAKTATFGYDGKGQIRISEPSQLESAWADLGNAPCVVESMLPLSGEISVVIARGFNGEIVVFPPSLNHHVAGILDSSVAPTNTGFELEAVEAAMSIVNELDYVGVMGVEFFIANDSLYVNEIAPRPHNSGHWTLDGAVSSQFDLQVQALTSSPLGDTAMTCQGVAMVNLLGDLWQYGEPNVAHLADHPNAHLYLYGKSEPRPGRKMGHLTVTAASPELALSEAIQLRATIFANS